MTLLFGDFVYAFVVERGFVNTLGLSDLSQISIIMKLYF